MTRDEFQVVLNNRLESAFKTLGEKEKEYASEGDRLANFKGAARFIPGGTPEKVLWGFLVKHLDSVCRIVYNEIDYDFSLVEEKIGDSINYLILLEALLIEKINLDNQSEPVCNKL